MFVYIYTLYTLYKFGHTSHDTFWPQNGNKKTIGYYVLKDQGPSLFNFEAVWTLFIELQALQTKGKFFLGALEWSYMVPDLCFVLGWPPSFEPFHIPKYSIIHLEFKTSKVQFSFRQRGCLKTQGTVPPTFDASTAFQ